MRNLEVAQWCREIANAPRWTDDRDKTGAAR
jgi:hypothetical protein